MNFSNIDFTIFGGYCLLILGVGLYVSRDKKGETKNAEDYFLASKSLPWWAVGASLIAANISAEQFIGMSGSGFAVGLAIASYEWMAAITLLIVGKYFLPIFIEKGLYTIPEFVEKRFSKELKTILAVFWIALYVFVNLSSVLYLGSLALETILGVPMMYGVICLSLFAAAYSLYGGLSAVAWTDVIQVVFLVLGGLMTTYLALNIVSDGEGIMSGFSSVWAAAPDKFHMILDETNEQYINLPGIWVLIGGLWVANIYYWGFNQYIIQRTLAAKSLKESQKGIALAAFLKIVIPFIVVLPGIACYVIVNDPAIMARLGEASQLNLPSAGQADKAYPWLLQLLPSGMKGMAFVAPLLGGIDQAFQFIQEYTGIVSPGILAVFILGLFWKKTTNQAAIWGALLSIPIAFGFKLIPETPLPWMNEMGLTALLSMVVIVIVSLIQTKGQDDEKGIELGKDLFKTNAVFNISAFAISLVVAALYVIFW